MEYTQSAVTAFPIFPQSTMDIGMELAMEIGIGDRQGCHAK
jgi:hypothetical protein